MSARMAISVLLRLGRWEATGTVRERLPGSTGGLADLGQELGVGAEGLHPVGEELQPGAAGALVSHPRQHPAQLPDLLELGAQEEQLLVAGGRGVDVDGRVDAALGQATIE